MPNSNANLLFRNDTVLGVCEAIGRDFGFHPNWLRLTLASLFYFYPAAVIGGYLAMGIVVAFTRWIAPDQTSTVSLAAPKATEVETEPLAIAA